MSSKNKIEWTIAFRNMFRNKWRTIATMSAVIAGFCGLCLLGGYIIRVEGFLQVLTVYNSQTGHFSIFKKDGADMFSRDPKNYYISNVEHKKIIEILEREDFKKQIEFTGRNLFGMGLISNGQNSYPFLARGTEPEVSNRILNHPVVNKWMRELTFKEQGIDLQEAVKQNPQAISITMRLGELLGLYPPFLSQPKEKRELQLLASTIDGGFNAYDSEALLMHVTGFKLTESTGLIAPLDLLQNLYQIEGHTSLSVYLNGENRSPKDIVKKLNNYFNENNLNFEAIPFYDDRLGQFYTGSMDFLYIMAVFFVFLICSAVAISIINAMTMGIIERAKEIGTMRSFGIDKKTVVKIFVKESFLISFFGSAIGWFLVQAIAELVNKMNIRFYPPGLDGSLQFVLLPTWWFCSLVFILIVIISILTGYTVSRKKLNQKIIDLFVS